MAAQVVGGDPPVFGEGLHHAAPDVAVASEAVGEEGGGSEPRAPLLDVEPDALHLDLACPQDASK